MTAFAHRSSCFRFVALLATAVLWHANTVVAATQKAVEQSSFAGSLFRAGSTDSPDGDILRRFEATVLTVDDAAFFVVTDDARRGCPWPDSFGVLAANGSADAVQPHLVYTYDGTNYVLPLPLLRVRLPEQIAEDVEWDHGDWHLRAISRKTVEGQSAWTLEASERRGRRQSLTVDAATGITLSAESDVFMGQGDQFQLTLARTSITALPSDTTARLSELQNELLSLQAGMKRRPDSFQRELSERQITETADKLPLLTTLAAESPLQSLVAAITRDLEEQRTRIASATDRAGKLIGTAAPEFVLALSSGGSLTGQSLAGRTVILHFWDYRDAPLSEPYGQTGYLEFLHNQKKSKNVSVVGISTNQELQTVENRARGLRSIRKLSEFMNLSYPIGYDDGSLLRAFGDPRDSRGQLPLWIVVTPDGKIAHYHAGHYEVDAAQGLKQLEAVLAEVVDAK